MPPKSTKPPVKAKAAEKKPLEDDGLIINENKVVIELLAKNLENSEEELKIAEDKVVSLSEEIVTNRQMNADDWSHLQTYLDQFKIPKKSGDRLLTVTERITILANPTPTMKDDGTFYKVTDCRSKDLEKAYNDMYKAGRDVVNTIVNGASIFLIGKKIA